MAARTNDAYGPPLGDRSGSGRRNKTGSGVRKLEGGPLAPLLSGVNISVAPAQGFCRDVQGAIDDEGK